MCGRIASSSISNTETTTNKPRIGKATTKAIAVGSALMLLMLLFSACKVMAMLLMRIVGIEDGCEAQYDAGEQAQGR